MTDISPKELARLFAAMTVKQRAEFMAELMIILKPKSQPDVDQNSDE